MTAIEPLSADPPRTGLAEPGFLALLAITTLFGLSFSTYFLLPKFLAVELAADPVTIGGVTTIFWLASVLVVPFAGHQIDRRGRLGFASIGGLLLALSCAGFVFVETIGPLIWLLRVAQGIGFTLFYVAAATLVADLSPPARLGQTLGLFGAVMIFTNAVGPAFAEWASVLFGWRVVFAATALTALLATLGTRLLREPEAPRTAGPHAGLLQVLRRPGMAPVILVSTLAGWVFGSLFTFYQPWALSLDIPQVSGYLVAYAVAAIAMRILAGSAADRLGRVPVVRTMLLLYVLAPLAVIWIDRIGLAAAGAILGVFQGIYYPALNAIAIELASAAERGKVMAAYNGAFNLGLSAAGLTLGHLAAARGYLIVFVLAAGVSLAMFLVFVLAFGRGPTAPDAAESTTTGPGE
jgi:MFS family permease